MKEPKQGTDYQNIAIDAFAYVAAGIRDAIKQGWTYREIANDSGADKSAVFRLAKGKFVHILPFLTMEIWVNQNVNGYKTRKGLRK